MQFEEVYSVIIQKLESELPANLSYHNAGHTKDVVCAVEYIAKSENISDYDFILLKTAALFHDTGFLKTFKNHEAISCGIAKEYLPKFEYSEEEITIICKLISATKIPQLPEDRLGEIICDADLFYFGTDNYFSKADNLFTELKSEGIIKNQEEWNKYQTEFLSSHHYFTQSAVKELNEKKQQNLLLLKATINQPVDIKKIHRESNIFSDLLLIVLGVIIAGFALEGFLVPNNFFDGGITGISLLLHELLHFNLSLIVLLANLPLIILSIYAINFRFALKTFLCITLLSVCLFYIHYPVVTSDKLLVSIFGGFFLGIGIGLTMRAGCAMDGIEVLALYTWRRTSFTVSEINLALNIIIFSVAALKFGVQTSLYSMLTYFTASKTIDYVVEGIEAYTGVTIISSKSDDIKSSIVNQLGRGITIYKGERGHLPGTFEISNECDIIFTVITRLELRKLKNVVGEIDPQAFVFANTIKEASGGVLKRRHIHQ